MTTVERGTSSQNPDPLLTVGQAADYLNLSQSSVRRAIYAGHLDARRLGGAIRVPTSAVHRFIAGDE